MSETAIDRKKARATARVAQAIAGLLLFSGVGAAMVLPRTTGNPAPADALAGIDEDVQATIAARLLEATDDDAEEEFPPDFAVRFMEAGFDPPEPPKEDPKPTPIEGGTPTEGGGNEVIEPPAPQSVVRYLGPIGVGSSRLALVSVNGAQAFIGEGRTKSVGTGEADRVEVKLVAVRDDAIDIVENGTERTIDRAERLASPVSVAPKAVAEAPEPEAQRRRGRVANTDRSVGARNPLDREQFRREDGTIDYEALRQAARERRDGGRAHPPGRRAFRGGQLTRDERPRRPPRASRSRRGPRRPEAGRSAHRGGVVVPARGRRTRDRRRLKPRSRG